MLLDLNWNWNLNRSRWANEPHCLRTTLPLAWLRPVPVVAVHPFPWAALAYNCIELTMIFYYFINQ